MPLNEKQVAAARKLEKLYSGRMFELADTPGTGFDNPDYSDASSKLLRVRRLLGETEQAARKVDENGKLTADAPSADPIRTFDDEFTAKQPSDYFYEPSVDEVRHRLTTDPDIVKRLGLQKYVRQLEPARPSANIGPLDPTTGISVLPGVQQPRTHLESMTSNSPDYKAVADEMWRERMEEGKARGRNLTRYSKVKLGDSPVDYLVGGAEKIWERGVMPAASTVGDALTLGSGRAKYSQNVRQANENRANGEMTVTPPHIDAEAVERRNPLLANIARIGAYALPAHPTNLGTNALLKAMGYGTTESLLGRGAVALTAAGTANAAENYATDVSRGVEAGVPDSENFREAANSVPENYAWGQVYGAPFELASNVMRGFRQNVRESASNNDLKTLRNARGDTAILGDNFSGYVAPPEIRQDVTAAAGWRHQGTAGDIAARRVAPQIQESLDNQLTEARKGIEAKNEAYFTHPAYQQLESSQDAVNAVLKLTDRGWVKGVVTGKHLNVDPDKLVEIGDALDGVAEKQAFNNLVKAQAYAGKKGGTVVEGHVAAAMYPSAGFNPKHYVVIAASPMNASSLTELERRIDNALNISNNRGRKDDPVYESFQRSIKNVRDRFPYYVDENDNLIDPPGWIPPASSGPTVPAKPRRTGRPSKRAPSAAAQAVPDTEPTPTDPGMPPTPKEPSTLGSEEFSLEEPTPKLPSTIGPEDVRALPPSTGPGGAPSEIPAFEFTAEKIQRELGVSPEEAQRIVNRLNGRDAEAVQLGSDEFSPATSSLGSDEVRQLPPSTEPEFTPKQPSALEWDEVEPLPSSIPSDDVRALPPSTEPRTRRSITPEDEAANYPDESVPGPMAQDWVDADKETGEWYEGIVRPGAPARSAEAQRMADLIEQQRGAAAEVAPKPGVEEAATRASQWIDAAFAGGDAPSASQRARMIAASVAHQVGRALTSDELKEVGKFVVPIAGGAAISEAAGDDDETGTVLGAMVSGFGSGMGGSKKPPSGPKGRQLQARGPKGEDLSGFSALRRRQHLELERLQKAGAGLGADSDKSVQRKVLGFNQHSATPEDAILLEEARKLGLEEELYRAAATGAYQRLKEQGTGGSPDDIRGGTRNILSRILGPRIDALAGMFTGEPTLFRGKQGVTEKGAREFLNISGGRAGARFGNDTDRIRDLISQLLFDSPRNQDEEKSNEAR